MAEDTAGALKRLVEGGETSTVRNLTSKEGAASTLRALLESITGQDGGAAAGAFLSALNSGGVGVGGSKVREGKRRLSKQLQDRGSRKAEGETLQNKAASLKVQQLEDALRKSRTPAPRGAGISSQAPDPNRASRFENEYTRRAERGREAAFQRTQRAADFKQQLAENTHIQSQKQQFMQDLMNRFGLSGGSGRRGGTTTSRTTSDQIINNAGRHENRPVTSTTEVTKPFDFASFFQAFG